MARRVAGRHGHHGRSRPGHGAGEETLGSGRAAMVIIEVVRPGMAAHTLAPCYVRTGVGWLGRRTPGGDVAWDRFFA